MPTSATPSRRKPKSPAAANRDWLRVTAAPAMPPETERLCVAWDALSSAIDAMLCAQPRQMTEAAARVESGRRAMREVVNAAALASMKIGGEA